MVGADESERKAIDEALKSWRQGDCVVADDWFLYRLDPERPLGAPAVTAAAEGVDIAEDRVRGFMVASQTCDVVRKCDGKPFVEVCPLVEVDADLLHQIERGRRPAYAFVPALAAQRIVADLDRVMTVEKAVVARWTRTPGWATDSEIRSLGRALARKRARFAFPDDFAALVDKLQRRVMEKHDKLTPEGIALRALDDIRVAAAPSWNAEEVDLTFWFIRGREAISADGAPWEDHLERWLQLVPDAGRFHVTGLIVTLEDLTARDYLESDPLDLDHLSTRAG